MTFRWKCKKFFLTFPQNEETKESLAARIHGQFQENVDCFVIVQEKHDDGGNHLHVMLHLNDKLESRDAKYFDCLGLGHGNYQKQKGAKGNDYACIKYLTKEDPSPLCFNFDVQSVLTKKGKKHDVVASLLLDGATPKDLMQSEEHRGFFLLHSDKIRKYHAMVQAMDVTIKEPWNGGFTDGADGEEVLQWLEDTMVGGAVKHLYIQGPTNHGKTTFLRDILSRHWKGFSIPKECFFDGYIDDHFDYAFVDEMVFGHSMSWWLEWLRGADMTLRTKGGQVMRTKILPTVITSNYPIGYWIAPKEEPQLESWIARFTVVNLERPFKITKHPPSPHSDGGEVQTGPYLPNFCLEEEVEDDPLDI